MRDTRDRWRSPLAVPFRYRLPRPAALRHARRCTPRRQALSLEPARPTTICETTGDENALSDSGPYEDPPFRESRSWHVTFGFQSCPALSVAANANLYRLAGPEQRLRD